MVVLSCKEEVSIEEERPAANVTSKLIFDNIGGKDIVVVGNPSANFIVSFEQKLSSGDIPDLEVVNGRLPIVMEDREGNFYDVFGLIVEGERQGEYLLPILSYQSYWFAIAAFYPGIELHNRGAQEVSLNLKSNPEWSIPTTNLFVGTGFGAIPAIDNPKFNLINNDGPNIDQAKIPANDDLVIGLIEEGEPFAYPHNILNWHEVLNQKVEDTDITITFCPLTGTAIGWKGDKSFGVSGLLYNSNLIAYDRVTESLWSQMTASSINGELRDEKLEVISLTETTWGTWSTMYPDTKLLSTETGYSRDYDQTPYRGYSENNDLIYYPLDYQDDRLPNKERVHVVIIEKEAKVYDFDSFY
tara:strand:- start:51471 stop:52541 length:1071 start_codon:yes stop_codon:yes gene_type:complete